MNKLEISGIQNLKGFVKGGWEIYHIEETESSYFLKLRPERDWENAKHAAVAFDKEFVLDPSFPEYGGKKIKTVICYEKLVQIIHEEEVYINIFKTKDDLWQGIVGIIEHKGVKRYGR